MEAFSMNNETNRAPSSTDTAGDRQSIDSPEFREILAQYAIASRSEYQAARRALIAHINTWGEQRDLQGFKDQVPRIMHLTHERDMALQAGCSAGDAVPAAKPLAYGHRDDYYLMANARRLAEIPIAEAKVMPNWVLAKNLFATGSNSARQICLDAGIDPDGYKVVRKTLSAHQAKESE
jgi:hypothetical protein